MKAVIQRVKEASVEVDGTVISSISDGILILLGVTSSDTKEEAELLARKCADLRIFSDEDDKMNLSVKDINGEALVVSNFTLCADTKKGNRPSYISAMEPVCANEYYRYFCEKLRNNGVRNVSEGKFRADMKVRLLNDGPITVHLDTDTWRKK